MPVEDSVLRGAVAEVSQQIGLTSKNLRVDQITRQSRILGYNFPLEDCKLRDERPRALAALKDAPGLSSIHFASSLCDRQALGGTGDQHPHIEITPEHLGLTCSVGLQTSSLCIM